MKFINIRRHRDEDVSAGQQAYHQRQLQTSLFIPFFFVAILWLVKAFEWTGMSLGFLTDNGLAHYGVMPRELIGLRGILFAPFLHGDINHLASNSVPLLVLGFLLFNTYRQVAAKVTLIVFFIGNVLLWLVGREDTVHIGASGLVYGLAFFLFFSGVFRKDMRSIALALLVAFLYGSMVWGIFPTAAHISFEGHATGALVGTLLAWRYREIGRAPAIEWDDEEEEEQEHTRTIYIKPGARDGGNQDSGSWRESLQDFRYTYRPKNEQ